MDAVVEAVRNALSDDLRHERYRGDHLTRGHCYVASEAVYHLLGGKAAGIKPMFVRVDGGSHWFLRKGDEIIDPTADQFDSPPDYSSACKGNRLLNQTAVKAVPESA